MVLSLSDRIALALTDSLLDVNRLVTPARARTQSAMRVLERKVVAILRAVDIDDAVTTAGRRQRIERALRKIERAVERSFKDITAVVKGGIDKALVSASKSAAKAGKQLLGGGKRLSKAERAAMLRDHLVLGETIDVWLQTQSSNLIKRLSRELRIAAATNESAEAVLVRVRGEKTGRTIQVVFSTGRRDRVPEHKGGVFDNARLAMDTLVRTFATGFANEAWSRVQNDSDAVIGWAAVTVLDERTSRICMARTGALWFLDGKPMPQSTRNEQFPGPPPWHPNCRSSLVAVTDRTLKRMKITTFDDVLEERGDAWARRKLGPGLFDLWKAGRITLSQLVDQAGRYRPLSVLSKNPRKP